MDFNNNNGLGSNMETFSMDLGQGYTLRERADFSGHMSGRVDPHLNSEIIGPCGLPPVGRDLANNQLPGMNGMQSPGPSFDPRPMLSGY